MKINNRNLIIFLFVLFIISISFIFLFLIVAKEKKHLFFFSFSPVDRSDIKVNSESVFNDRYDDYSNDIYSITLNSLYQNSISVKWNKQKIRIKDINKKDYIKIHIIYKDKLKIKHIVYKLHLLPSHFPSYTIENKGIDYGTVLISIPIFLPKTEEDRIKYSYALIMDTNGKILFYRAGYKKGQFNIQKWHFKDNKVFYSIFQNYENDPIKMYFGEYYILNDRFNIIDKVNIQATEQNITVDTDEHDLIMIDENHYIVFGYTYLNRNNMLLFNPIIQEIKNGKIIFNWVASDHIDYSKILYYGSCHYHTCDPIHINAISIDPKDNNLLVSFKHLNTIVKIDRKTGKIMWQLGGQYDDYNLSLDESFCMQHHPQYYKDSLYIFDNSCTYKSNVIQDTTSRILKYKLDEKSHKVLFKDEFSLNEYIQIGGSLQMINDDKMMIGCGTGIECNAFIISKNRDILWKLKIDKPYDTYRAYYYKN